MISGISYGTYLVFGILTFIGAAFIWFVVPETTRLTLEEMDTVFGSEGTAQADLERLDEINKEIGLDRILRGNASGSGADGRLTPDEKLELEQEKEHQDETLAS
jgi:hypothetical protein